MKNSNEANAEGKSTPTTRLEIAPGIIESMVAIAASEVDGVASVGNLKIDMGGDSVMTEFNRPDGVDIIEDDGQIVLDISIQMYTGHKLTELANAVKSSVYDALLSQTGIKAKEININVSGLQVENGK
ncbi:MAG: Asp23/Gls24 family envelope stress response protein [bacterium]|nr:Asp23/Gls24 family envelope stress response protein [bacterium]